MAWFEIGLKMGLGLIAAGVVVSAVFIVLAVLYISFTEREQRKKHRQTKRVLAKWEGTD